MLRIFLGGHRWIHAAVVESAALPSIILSVWAGLWLVAEHIEDAVIDILFKGLEVTAHLVQELEDLQLWLRGQVFDLVVLEVAFKVINKLNKIKGWNYLLTLPLLSQLPKLIDALPQLPREQLLQLIDALNLLIQERTHQQLRIGPHITILLHFLALGSRRLLSKDFRIVYYHNLVLVHLKLILHTAVVAELMVPHVVIAKAAVVSINEVLFWVIETLLIACFFNDSVLHGFMFAIGTGCII